MIDEARRNAASAIEGRTRFLASAYGLTLFFSRREGAPFLKTLIAAAVEGRPLESAFGTATSFTPAVTDIDRQWRVWLASYAYGPGRQPPE